MKKVLILSYYWPPSGGAGVQRWLKLSKYLAIHGVDVHVITVDSEKASYAHRDESLSNDIHPAIHLHRTNTFEPLKYYEKLVGKGKVPTAGFSNVNNQSFMQRTVASLRSNLFIPDPRKGWKKYAAKKALEIIEKENIEYVVTTSPPHSAQLIGLALKKQLGNKIKWIADLRDPWTDIYYYELLNHSKWSHKKDAAYEKEVVEKADALVTIGDLFKSSYLSKATTIKPEKIATIPNGYDPEDFQDKETVKQATEFTVTYTGTMSDYYEPYVFFSALNRLIALYPNDKINLKLVGMVSENIQNFIQEKIGNSATFIPMVQHGEAIRYMLETHVLLLITQGEKGTIPGKTFEYLATGRRIVCIGTGDAANIIEKCNAGKGFNRKQENEVFDYLKLAFSAFKNQAKFSTNTQNVLEFSRKEQALKMEEIIFA